MSDRTDIALLAPTRQPQLATAWNARGENVLHVVQEGQVRQHVLPRPIAGPGDLREAVEAKVGEVPRISDGRMGDGFGPQVLSVNAGGPISLVDGFDASWLDPIYDPGNENFWAPMGPRAGHGLRTGVGKGGMSWHTFDDEYGYALDEDQPPRRALGPLEMEGLREALGQVADSVPILRPGGASSSPSGAPFTGFQPGPHPHRPGPSRPGPGNRRF